MLNKKNHFTKKLDHAGAVFLPAVVICFCRAPSATMIKICLPPAREDSNAICRLSGDHTGCSLLPESRVNWIYWPVTISAKKMSKFPVSTLRQEKTILSPSGLQEGPTA